MEIEIYPLEGIYFTIREVSSYNITEKFIKITKVNKDATYKTFFYNLDYIRSIEVYGKVEKA